MAAYTNRETVEKGERTALIAVAFDICQKSRASPYWGGGETSLGKQAGKEEFPTTQKYELGKL